MSLVEILFTLLSGIYKNTQIFNLGQIFSLKVLRTFLHRIFDCFFLLGRKKLSKSHTGIVLGCFGPYFLQVFSQLILAAHHSLRFFRFFSKFSISTVFSLRLEEFSNVPKISSILSFLGQHSPGKKACAKDFKHYFPRKHIKTVHCTTEQVRK